jgi:hypothetical protein
MDPGDVGDVAVADVDAPVVTKHLLVLHRAEGSAGDEASP